MTIATEAIPLMFDRSPVAERSEPLVEVENLEVTFRRGSATIHALRGVSVDRSR